MKTCLSFWYSSKVKIHQTAISTIILLILNMISVLDAQNLVLSDTMTITGVATYDNVTIQPGGKLTFNGVLTVNQNMTVESGGVVTHSPRFEAGLTLNVAGILDVQNGGAINVNEKGLKGGLNGSVFSDFGETYNDLGQIISGSSLGDNMNNPGWGAAGGSYGGRGAFGRIGHATLPDLISNEEYGTLENPDRLGSGGGATLCGGCNRPGGNGGGLIIIMATQLIVNGIIASQGGVIPGSSSLGGGSGSGGAIKITASNISGTGTIQANGGNNTPYLYVTGAGGGGRVAIYYSTLSLPLANISATGGYSLVGSSYNYFRGSAGTIYLKVNTEANGRVIIDDKGTVSQFETALKTNLTVVNEVQFIGSVKVRYVNPGGTNLDIIQPVILQNSSKLRIGTGSSLSVSNSSGFDFVLSSGAALDFDSASVVSTSSISIDNATLDLDINFTFSQPGDILLTGNSTMNVGSNAVLTIPSFNSTNFISGVFNLKKGCTIVVGSNSMVIGNGVTWIKDGKTGSTDELQNLTIQSGGIVTHSAKLLSGLNLNITGTLDIQTDGQINASGKGLKGGGAGGSAFGRFGEAFNVNGDIIQGAGGSTDPNTTQSPGGSYGGYGGRSPLLPGETNTPYGLLENPLFLGAGGASYFNYQTGGAFGGNGGGRVTIVTNTLILNGSIKVNGSNGGYNGGCCPFYGGGGGGSGGSIKITASIVSGIGTLEAKGGGVNNFNDPCGGGGGRIAVYYDNITLPDASFIAAGSVPISTEIDRIGGAGTTFLKNNISNETKLLFNNNGLNNRSKFLPGNTSITTFTNVKVINNCQIELPNTGIFRATSFLWDTTACRIVVPEGGTVLLTDPNMILDGWLVKDGVIGQGDSLNTITINNRGKISHSPRFLKGLKLKAKTIVINPGGSIDVTADGLKGGLNGSIFGETGETFDYAGKTIITGPPAGGNGGKGGSYAGIGRGNNPTSKYGDPYFPNLLGSGGISGTWNIVYGNIKAGNGGGKALIRTRKIQIDGKVMANGETWGGAGVMSGNGSGGSILIFADTIAGTGTIESKGAGCLSVINNCDGAGGGGGRVALYTLNPLFPQSNINTDGGISPGTNGTVGSIVYQNCAFENNVGVDTIIYPNISLVPFDSTIIPIAVVRNYSPNTLTFPVTFRIGSTYEDMATVTLPSGNTDTIHFAAWRADQVGTLTATCTTDRQGDVCTFNNEKSTTVAMSVAGAPSITNVSPNNGGNTGSVTVKITGANFLEGIHAWIQLGGGAQIIANYVQVVNSTTLFATFNLQGTIMGFYNVAVQNPDMQNAMYNNGFHVTPGTIGWGGVADPNCLEGSFDVGQLLTITVSHTNVVRSNGPPFEVIVSYVNTSNIDLPVPTRIIKSTAGNPMALTPDEFCSGCGATSTLSFLLTEPGGPQNILRAGASGEFKFYMLPGLSCAFEIVE